MVLTSFSCTQQEATLTAPHFPYKHGQKRPQKCRKTRKMMFFGPVLQISLVIKLMECHQSQNFSNLAKCIQKGCTTSNFQQKTFLHDKFSVPQAKFSCDFYFFQFWTCYTRNKASGRNIIWRIAPFHVLKRSPPFLGLNFFFHHLIRRQNGPKPVKLHKF